MNTDRIAGFFFLALALLLIGGAMALPEGTGRLPGSGFFPLGIGIVMAAMAAALLRKSFTVEGQAFSLGQWGLVRTAAGLTFVYLLLWGTGLFALRTALFLALLLRTAGQSWKSSVAVAAALSAAATLAFQYGLRVTLE